MYSKRNLASVEASATGEEGVRLGEGVYRFWERTSPCAIYMMNVLGVHVVAFHLHDECHVCVSTCGRLGQLRVAH